MTTFHPYPLHCVLNDGYQAVVQIFHGQLKADLIDRFGIIVPNGQDLKVIFDHRQYNCETIYKNLLSRRIGNRTYDLMIKRDEISKNFIVFYDTYGLRGGGACVSTSKRKRVYFQSLISGLDTGQKVIISINKSFKPINLSLQKKVISIDKNEEDNLILVKESNINDQNYVTVDKIDVSGQVIFIDYNKTSNTLSYTFLNEDNITCIFIRDLREKRTVLEKTLAFDDKTTLIGAEYSHENNILFLATEKNGIFEMKAHETKSSKPKIIYEHLSLVKSLDFKAYLHRPLDLYMLKIRIRNSSWTIFEAKMYPIENYIELGLVRVIEEDVCSFRNLKIMGSKAKFITNSNIICTSIAKNPENFLKFEQTSDEFFIDEITVDYGAEPSVVVSNNSDGNYGEHLVRTNYTKKKWKFIARLLNNLLHMIENVIIMKYDLYKQRTQKDAIFLRQFSIKIFQFFLDTSSSRKLNQNLNDLKKDVEEIFDEIESRFINECVFEATVQNLAKNILSDKEKNASRIKAELPSLISKFLKSQILSKNMERELLFIEGFSKNLKKNIYMSEFGVRDSLNLSQKKLEERIISYLSYDDYELIPECSTEKKEVLLYLRYPGEVKNLSFKIVSQQIAKIRARKLLKVNLLDANFAILVEIFNNHTKKENLDNENIKLLISDIYNIISSAKLTYAAKIKTITIDELQQLIPICFIDNNTVYRQFFNLLLEDLDRSQLFDPEKFTILSYFILGGIQNKHVKPDDLATCIDILSKKIMKQTITDENVNIQTSMDVMGTLLYLMGVLNTKGFEESKKQQIKELIKYMETHSFEKLTQLFNKKFIDPSLPIKREYVIEALKNIKATKYEINAENQALIQNSILNLAECGVKIMSGNIAGGVQSLGRMASEIYKHTHDNSKKWYDKANSILALTEENLHIISFSLFEPKGPAIQGVTKILIEKDRNLTFYVIELLLTVLKQNKKKFWEKKLIIDMSFMLLKNEYLPKKNSKVQKKKTVSHFNEEIDLKIYFTSKLAQLEKNFDDNILQYYLKTKNSYLESLKKQNEHFFKAEETSMTEKANEILPKKMYIDTVMAYQHSIYVKEKLKKYSDEVLLKQRPQVYIEVKGILKEHEEKLQPAISWIKSFKLTSSKTLTCEEKPKDFGAIFSVNDTQYFMKKDTDMTEMIDVLIKKILGNLQGNQKEPIWDMNKLIWLQNLSRNAIVMNYSNHMRYLAINFIKNEGIFAHSAFLYDGESKTKDILLLQGDAGTGKSILLREIENHFLMRENIFTKDGTSILPVLVVLSEIVNLKRCLFEALEKRGMTSEAINDFLEACKKTNSGENQEKSKSRLLILFDGFDELRQPVNLYLLNSLKDYNCKVIYSSRREYLKSFGKEYLAFFGPYQNHAKDANEILEYNITDVDFLQRADYFNQLAQNNSEKYRKYSESKKNLEMLTLKNILKSKDYDWTNQSTYENQILELKIVNIVNTPLMLSIVSQSLPELIYQNKDKEVHVTRAKLYEVFTEEHLNREFSRLQRIGVQFQKGFDLKKSSIEYSKHLAWEMFLQNKTSIITESVNYSAPNAIHMSEIQFSQFFNDSIPKIKFARQSSQLVELDGICKFVHKSIMEYFVALMIYDNLVYIYQEQNNIDNQDLLQNVLIGKKLLIEEETDVLRFLIDMIDTDTIMNDEKELKGIKFSLWKILCLVHQERESKGNDSNSILWENVALLTLANKDLARELAKSNEKLQKDWDYELLSKIEKVRLIKNINDEFSNKIIAFLKNSLYKKSFTLWAIAYDDCIQDKSSETDFKLFYNDRLFIKACPNFLQHASPDIQKDTTFILILIQKGLTFDCVPKNRRSDPLIYSEYIKRKDKSIISLLDLDMVLDESLLLEILKINPMAYDLLSPEFRTNYEFIKKAVEANPMFAYSVLKSRKKGNLIPKQDMKKFILNFINQAKIYPRDFDLRAFYNDEEFREASLKYDTTGKVYYSLNPKMKEKAEYIHLARYAVPEIALKRFPDELGSDKKLLENLVRRFDAFIKSKNPKVLGIDVHDDSEDEYKSKKEYDFPTDCFKAITDPLIGRWLVDQCTVIFEHLNTNLQHNHDIIEAYSRSADINNSKFDDDINKILVEKNYTLLPKFPKIRENIDFLKNTIKLNYKIYLKMFPEQKSDENFIVEALKQNKEAYHYLSNEIKKKNFVREWIDIDEDIKLSSFEKDERDLLEFSKLLKNNFDHENKDWKFNKILETKEDIISKLKINYYKFVEIDEVYKRDDDIVNFAMTIYPDNFNDFPRDRTSTDTSKILKYIRRTRNCPNLNNILKSDDEASYSLIHIKNHLNPEDLVKDDAKYFRFHRLRDKEADVEQNHKKDELTPSETSMLNNQPVDLNGDDFGIQNTEKTNKNVDKKFDEQGDDNLEVENKKVELLKPLIDPSQCKSELDFIVKKFTFEGILIDSGTKLLNYIYKDIWTQTLEIFINARPDYLNKNSTQFKFIYEDFELSNINQYFGYLPLDLKSDERFCISLIKSTCSGNILKNFLNCYKKEVLLTAIEYPRNFELDFPLDLIANDKNLKKFFLENNPDLSLKYLSSVKFSSISIPIQIKYNGLPDYSKTDPLWKQIIEDKDLLLEILKSHGKCYKKIVSNFPNYQKDLNLFKGALSNYPEAFDDAHPDFKADKNIIRLAISSGYNPLYSGGLDDEYKPSYWSLRFKEYKSDEEIMLLAMRHNFDSVEHFSPELIEKNLTKALDLKLDLIEVISQITKDKKGFILKNNLLKLYPELYDYLYFDSDENLKNDEEIINEVKKMKNEVLAWQIHSSDYEKDGIYYTTKYINPEDFERKLKNAELEKFISNSTDIYKDYDIFRQDNHSREFEINHLKNIEKAFKKEKNYLMMIAIYYANLVAKPTDSVIFHEIFLNFSLMHVIIQSNISSLRHFDLAVEKKQLYSEVLLDYPEAYKYSSYKLHQDRSIFLLAARSSNNSLIYAHRILREQSDLAWKAIKQNAEAYMDVESSLRDLKPLVLEAFYQDASLFWRFSSKYKSDKELIDKALRVNGRNIDFLDENLKRDEAYVRAALKKNGLALKYLDLKFKSVENLVLLACRTSPKALKYASEELRKNKAFVFKAIQIDGMCLKYADHSLRSDCELSLHAVKENPDVYKYLRLNPRKDKGNLMAALKSNPSLFKASAYSELREDDEVIRIALRDGENLFCLPLHLRYHHDYIKLAITSNLNVIKEFGKFINLKMEKELVLRTLEFTDYMMDFIPYCFKNDKQFMLEAVKRNPENLKYGSYKVKTDLEILSVAIQRGSAPFVHLHHLFKDYESVVEESVKRNPKSILEVHYSLAQKKEFVLKLLKSNPSIYKYASRHLIHDENFNLAAIKLDPANFKFSNIIASCKNQNIVYEAVKLDGSNLKYADEYFKSNKKAVYSLLRLNGQAYQFIDQTLKDNQFFVQLALESPRSLAFIDESNQKKNKDHEKNIILKNPELYKHAFDELKADREFTLAVVKLNGLMLYYADASLIKDKEIVLAAVKQNGEAYESMDPSLLDDKTIVSEAFKTYIDAFRFDDELRANRDIVLKAVKKKGSLLKFAEFKFWDDEEILLEAIKNDHTCFELADGDKKRDPVFQKKALKANPKIIIYCENLLNNREHILQVVNSYPMVLSKIKKWMLIDQEFLKQIGQTIDYKAFETLDETLKRKISVYIRYENLFEGEDDDTCGDDLDKNDLNKYSKAKNVSENLFHHS